MVHTGGRKATPTSLKILRGNPRKENLSAITAREPKSPAAGIDPVEGLAGLALQKWHESVPMLSTMRVWGEAERETWARYCRLYALWRECHEVLLENGQTYERPSGVIAARPETALLLQYGSQMIRIECEFGLTPSSRAGAAAIREEDDDPMARFLAEAT